MKKTDIEIAADCIKHCRNELAKFERLIEKADNNELIRINVNSPTYDRWCYEAGRLRYVLGEQDFPPKPYWEEEDK